MSKAKPKRPANRAKTGQGKPPKEHQFKPGVSGNPSGRPKKKPITEMFERILNETRNIEAIEAAVLKTLRASGSAQVSLLNDMANRIEGKITDKIEHSGLDSLADKIAASRARIANRKHA